MKSTKKQFNNDLMEKLKLAENKNHGQVETVHDQVNEKDSTIKDLELQVTMMKKEIYQNGARYSEVLNCY